MTRLHTAENQFLISALACIKRGWSVFPCTERDKTPATQHGFKDGTTEKARVVGFWRRYPKANLAIVTGKISGIVVLDEDPRNGGVESLRKLTDEYGPLPDTLRVSTGGGGHHYYFKIPAAEIRSGKLADGIDVKATGGYVVAPPSVHPSGKHYKWLGDLRTAELAECPEWIVSRMAKPKVLPKKHSEERNAADAGTSPLGKAFERLGMLGRLLDGGKRTIVCPWQDKHTAGAVHDSSTVLFPPSEPGGLGGFHCSHSHCSTRGAAEVLRELELRIAAGAAEQAWTSELRRTSKNEIRTSLSNLVTILTHDSKYRDKIRLDEMRGAIVLGSRELTDAMVSGIRVDIEKRYAIQPPDADTVRAVQFVATKNGFHPVRDWLLSLTWDGTPRLHSVAAEILHARYDTEEEALLASLLVRKWFLSLVARALEPGCKVDTALILQGGQGVGKSTFFRGIAGEWFSDTEMELDKDALIQLRMTWIYEWAELETVTGRHAVSRIKAFLTSTEDKYRPPYGRAPVTVKRSGVIVGTTNEHDFLHDPSGNRRFWVVPVGKVDIQRLKSMREQLLAEAVVARKKGERYWLSEAEEAQREAMASKFIESDPWDERVLEFANAQVMVKTHDVLLDALKIGLDKLTKRDEMRVAQILKRNGFDRVQRRIDGKMQRYWTRAGRS